MSRVIIFTGSTGGGHTQVANTLSEELRQRGHEVIVTDLLKDYSKTSEFIFLNTYNFMYARVPYLYGVLYRVSNHKFTKNFSDTLFSSINLEKIVNFIRDKNPDIIISVHPFGSGVLSRLKTKKVINCPVVVLVTEFKAHYIHIGKQIDCYIVSNRYTKQDLIRKGVNPSLIYPTGIPINKKFDQKSTDVKHNTPFTVLLMGGSKGEKFIKNALAYIAINRGMKIIVICGKNEKLKAEMIQKYSNRPDIDIRGFETNIQELMGEADVIVTKPGAITITEAISQELPMVIPYAIRGHESDNAKFLVRAGMAKRTYSYIQLGHTIEKMIKNPEIIDDIKKNIQYTEKRDRDQSSIDIIDGLIEGSQITA